MPAWLSTPALRRLARRRPLALDPARPVAIKRSVHDFDIGCDARTFAAALTTIMSASSPLGSAFGRIEVRRHPAQVGRAFVVGERFLGSVRASRLVGPAGCDGWLARLLDTPAVARLEEALMSDYAEVVALELAPREGAPYRVVYRYLSGTPMAGESTFLVEPKGAGRCRFRCIFEYQELGALQLSVLQRFGVKLHDEVTLAQATRAAALAGAPLLSSTVRISAQRSGGGVTQ